MAKVNRQILASDGKTLYVPGQDYDISAEDMKQYESLGIIDNGDDRNGAVDGAARMGTTQVIAGENPETGQLDTRGLDDQPTVTDQRNLQIAESTADDMAASGNAARPNTGPADEPKGDTAMTDAKANEGAPENKATATRARKSK